MKKLIFLILLVNLYASCDIFTDVLQTRHDPSHIRMDGDGYIYNSPSCNLNTGYIQADSSHRLICNHYWTDAKATGNYGKSLNINYNFSIDSSNVSDKPANGEDTQINSNNEILTLSDYNKILEDSNHYSFTLNYNGNKKINEIDNISNTITFANNANHNIYIGYLNTKNYNNTNINFTSNPKNIYIFEFYNKGSNKLITDLNATQTIKIHNLKLNSSANTNVIISAPKVVIDNLLSTNNDNTVTIYADEIDINTIQFAQHSKLIIHPYTPGNKVIFYSDTITSSSSSTMILDSGNYYTNSLSIPGSSDVSSIRIANNNQVVNFYINGDFRPGNNPGINSDGNNGNFGSLTPANFRLFINGNLSTGGGGTTFNAVVYVEGDAILGSPTYIKGGVSANNEITVQNDSKFYYDSSVNSSSVNDLCSNEKPKFQNLYSCDIFPSVLTSYQSINANNNDVFHTCNISTNSLNGGLNCNDCNNNCDITPPPSNRYSHNFIASFNNSTQIINKDITLNNLKYGNVIFDNDNQIATFSPDNNYSDKNISVMLIKDANFTANNQTLILKSGDYYFNSLNINDSNFNFCANGNVRIFIKNDFNYNASNLNNNCNGNIFMFVEGNANINTMNGNSGDINLTLYAKGNVNIKNNSNEKWNGAITSEKNINITGNNIKFYYNPFVLDNFGVGKCGLCYDSNYLSQNGFSMFMFTLCTPFTPCVLDMPIKNTTKNNLNAVKVMETYKSSFNFAPTFFGFNTLDTVDKNDNHVGNGAYKDNSADYSMFNLFDLSLNNKAIVYDFGNNYPKYSNNKNYYKAYKKSLMSFSMNLSPENLFNAWKNNVVYLAQYLNEGRLYNVKLKACPVEPGVSIINGDFGAWDTNRNKNDQNISTKIVNKPFNLIIKFLSDRDITDSFKVEYYLFDANTKSLITLPNTTNFLVSNTNKSIIPSFNIDKAYQNVKVGFKVCADYALGEFNYKSFSDCSSDCTSNDEEDKVCFRYFESRDAFAIRPDRFMITNPSYVRADNNISGFSIKALDKLNNPTNEYNQTNSNIQISANDVKSCQVSPFNYDINFYNGTGNVNYIKYPEVGKLNVKVIDDKFAQIDSDDTNYNDRIIKGNFNITVIPDHFDINVNNVGNYKGKPFTYLSRDLNMSGELNATITAVNKNNVIMKNYTTNCYAKQVEINISHNSDTSMENLNKIITQYSKNDKDKNISFILNENNFTNGVLTLNLKINFDRDISAPTNPFNLTLKSIFVTDENKTHGFKDINGVMKFIYGKILTNDKTSVLNDTNLTIIFEKYNNGWSKNIIHTNANEGKVYHTFSKQLANIIINDIKKGEQNITVSPSTNIRPYKVRLHLFIPTWLWYSKGGVVYKSPSNDNTDCTTHPCINILFLPQSRKNWIGTGTNEVENNVSKHSINININAIKDRSYHKINW